MVRYICISCGAFIRKASITDQYMCRDCEKMLEGDDMEARYTYLERY